MSAASSLKSPSVPWWLVLLEGIAAVILGILLLIAPGKTLLALVSLVGLYFIIRGILAIVGLFVDRSQWFAKLIIGVLGILVGLFVMEHPLWVSLAVPLTVSWVMGLGLLTAGLVGMGMALQGSGWGYGVLGFLGIVLSIPFILDPSGKSTALPVILGIAAIIGGIAAIVMAWRWRQEA